jgi:transcription elongation factor Elf1
MDQHEKFFDCPHCGKVVSVLLDLSVPNQEYIEDCEVCCRPIEISYQINADGEIGFEGERG